jgi:hypothetical protein
LLLPRAAEFPRSCRPTSLSLHRTCRPAVPRTELRPGVFLTVTGFLNPTLSLSGPGVDQTFRERLESWVATGR